MQTIFSQIEVGNLYINRNQIGAVVGSQLFGGHGLSGTGPKAGGPRSLPRFGLQTIMRADRKLPAVMSASELEVAFMKGIEPCSAVAVDLPGPTGESNR